MAPEYISQVFEEIEGKVCGRLSKEFSRTKSRIPDALSKLDEFLLNSQVRTCSVAVTGTSWNSNSGNRKPNGDRSPERSLSRSDGLLSSLWYSKGLRAGRVFSHGDRRSRRDSISPSQGDRNSRRVSLLLSWIFAAKTKEGALYVLALISQWKHLCDYWSRPDIVSPSTVGDEK